MINQINKTKELEDIDNLHPTKSQNSNHSLANQKQDMNKELLKYTLNQQLETDNSERIKVRSFVYNKSESNKFNLSSQQANEILTDRPI